MLVQPQVTAFTSRSRSAAMAFGFPAREVRREGERRAGVADVVRTMRTYVPVLARVPVGSVRGEVERALHATRCGDERRRMS